MRLFQRVIFDIICYDISVESAVFGIVIELILFALLVTSKALCDRQCFICDYYWLNFQLLEFLKNLSAIRVALFWFTTVNPFFSMSQALS